MRNVSEFVAGGFLLLSLCLGLADMSAAMQIVDAAGRRVTVPESPQRIVCLCSGCLRLIVYLGASDKVVGIEKFEKDMAEGRPYRLARPELLNLPVITPGGPKSLNQLPDLEGVLSVSPQVVFICFMEPGKADELQAKLNIPVVVLSYGKFAGYDPRVFDSLKIAGQILNKEKRATELEEYTLKAQKDVEQRAVQVKAAERPKAYVGATGFKGLHGLTSTDNPYTPLKWVNADNLASRLVENGHVFLDKEKLLELDPPVIFIDAAGLKLVAEDYAAKPEYYQALQAFKERKVYVLYPYTTYVTNLETMILDAYAAGRILYPEAFADVDLAAKSKQVYEFFLEKDVSGQMAASYGGLGELADFLK